MARYHTDSKPGNVNRWQNFGKECVVVIDASRVLYGWSLNATDHEDQKTTNMVDAESMRAEEGTKTRSSHLHEDLWTEIE